MRKFICTIIASAFFFAGGLFSAANAEAKPVQNKSNLVVCGTVKVGKFFKVIECNPNA